MPDPTDSKQTRYNTTRCQCGAITSTLAGERIGSRRLDAGISAGRQVVSGWVSVHASASGEVVVSNGSAVVKCRGCWRTHLASPVRGRYRADKRCDARCTSAIGHKCECQCGGKNHGAGHEAPGAAVRGAA